MIGRYTHAHQFKRMRRELRSSSCAPGSAASSAISAARLPAVRTFFGRASTRCSISATKVSIQDHRQRGPKIYSLHAPEVECIGNQGKARAPYEFGCKVSASQRR